MKLKSLVEKCRNAFDRIVVQDQMCGNLIFDGKEGELTDCVLERKVMAWQTNNCCLFIEVKREIKNKAKEEVKPKADYNSLICFLRQHLDLDEDKTVIHYVNIEGKTVEIKLSELKWKYEEFCMLFDVKIKYRINRQGVLVLYLEDLRE